MSMLVKYGRGIFVIMVFLCIYVVDGYSLKSVQSVVKLGVRDSVTRKCERLQSSQNNDSTSSRRRRRSTKTAIKREEETVVSTPKESTKTENTKTFAVDSVPSKQQISRPNEESVEKLFGLGDDQLRDLLEQEIPLPKEDLVTRKAVDDKKQKGGVFNLPELSEYLKETEKDKKAAESKPVPQKKKVSRRNEEEYLKLLQLNPFADADESLFVEEYDIFPSIFGSGKLLNIPVPYLQTGHGILLLVCLLSGFVYAPGNPLTEFPSELRDFIKTGLFVIFSVNVVLAVQAYFQAKAKNLPGIFWAMKSFILGGIAYYELSQAKDPTKLSDSTNSNDIRKRK